MPYVAVTRTIDGLIANPQPTRDAALRAVRDTLVNDFRADPMTPLTDRDLDDAVPNPDEYSFDIHELDLSSLYEHVCQPELRLALITHDPRYGRDAYDTTLRCFTDDLLTDPCPVDEPTLQARTEILRALNASPDRSSPQFWSRLDAYWST